MNGSQDHKTNGVRLGDFSVADEIDPRVPGRQCGSCTMCCKVLGITELNKPAGTWCQHCAIGRGCKIYETRPAECRRFFCGFLQDRQLGEDWRPSKSKIVLASEGNRITAHVDPERPGAWRRPTFYATLKEWSVRALTRDAQVVVSIGARSIVILPDKDVDLGVVGADEFIAIEESATGEVSAFKMKRDDPRAAGMRLGQWRRADGKV